MTLEEAQTRPLEAWQSELLECFRRISEIKHAYTREPRSKPLLGGSFGSGGFSICSYHFVDAGLDAAVYYVRVDASGFVIGSSEEKTEAISHARTALRVLDPFKLQQAMRAFVEWKVKHDADKLEQRQRAMEERRQQFLANPISSVKSIPRRRKQIFEADGGKCHYCATPLTLDGKWHIEHKMPKALGGDNQPGNLVASCVPCNVKKRDTTDVEFKARLAKRATA